MELNEYQIRLLAKMIKLIERYRKGELYFDFIYELEGLLDAGEYQDKGFVGQWYDYWTPLEIIFSTMGDSTTIEDVSKYLTEMERFLKRKYDLSFKEGK